MYSNLGTAVEPVLAYSEPLQSNPYHRLVQKQRPDDWGKNNPSTERLKDKINQERPNGAQEIPAKLEAAQQERPTAGKALTHGKKASGNM